MKVEDKKNDMCSSIVLFGSRREPIEEKEALSRMLQGEIEHGVASPDYARQRSGYRGDAGKGFVPNVTERKVRSSAVGGIVCMV